MLILGPVAFAAFEMPERISFGGRQRVAVHRLLGGGRVVDALGADEDEVAWSGTVSGPDAGARLRVLDGMRRGGGAWPLLWDGWRWQVVVTRLHVGVENPCWAPYRIRCTVLPEAGAADDTLPLGVLDGGAAAALDGVGPGEGLAGVLQAAGAMARLAFARVGAAP